MKSPEQLAAHLTRQWHNAHWREQRLLGGDNAWPVVLPIGLPPPALFTDFSPELRQHLAAWQAVDTRRVGEVVWEAKKYRSGASPVRVPRQWVLRQPSDWVAAAGDATVRRDYQRLLAVLAEVDRVFWRLLVRRLALWQAWPPDQVVTVVRVAMQLSPGCAGGQPLRSLAVAGADSKFFERHETLLKALLDERFDGEASRQGLVTFLDALDERDHWLLVVPMASGVLPFGRMRLAAADLKHTPLPAQHILVVENEQSLHQLPRPLPDTVAILGAGLDLGWLSSDWLRDKDVAYWGDMDTWGLAMLGRARGHLPHVRRLLMDRATFDAHAGLAVVESVGAPGVPQTLHADEIDFYRFLSATPRGRLEQEFLPPARVRQALADWLAEPLPGAPAPATQKTSGTPSPPRAR